MADWVWRNIADYATLPVLAGLFVLALIVIFVLFPLTKRHYKNIRTLDADPMGFSVRDAEYTLGKMTDTQLRAYRNQELYADMVFPIIYSLFFAVAMVMLVRYVGGPRWLVLLPFAIAIADYFENIAVLGMIGKQRRGEPLGSTASLGSVASRIKHALLLLTVLVLLGLCVWAVMVRMEPPSLK